MAQFEEQPTSPNRQRLDEAEEGIENSKSQLSESIVSEDSERILELGEEMKLLKDKRQEFLSEDEQEAYEENIKINLREAVEIGDADKIIELANQLKTSSAEGMPQNDEARLAEVRTEINNPEGVASENKIKPEDYAEGLSLSGIWHLGTELESISEQFLGRLIKASKSKENADRKILIEELQYGPANYLKNLLNGKYEEDIDLIIKALKRSRTPNDIISRVKTIGWDIQEMKDIVKVMYESEETLEKALEEANRVRSLEILSISLQKNKQILVFFGYVFKRM